MSEATCKTCQSLAPRPKTAHFGAGTLACWNENSEWNSFLIIMDPDEPACDLYEEHPDRKAAS